MRKIIILSIVIIAFFMHNQATAQLYPMYNLYNNNKFLYNPAHAGDKEELTAFVHSRRQWTGFEGAPKTVTFGLHTPTSEKVGLGLVIRSQKEGVFENFGANLSYDYKVVINDFQSLTFGVSGGFLNTKINQTKARVTVLEDPTLYDNYYDKTQFDAAAGLVYRWKNLEIDIAAPQLFTRSEHLVGMLSYQFNLAEKKYRIIPLVSYQMLPQSPNLYDAGLQLAWKERLWLSGMYRSNANMIFSCGFNFNSIGFAYSYEINNDELTNIAAGSHEVAIHFFFGNKIKPEKLIEKKSNKTEFEDQMESENYQKNKTDSLENEILRLKINSIDREREMERRIENMQNQIEEMKQVEDLSDINAKLDSIASLQDDKEVVTITYSHGGDKRTVKPITSGNYVVIYSFRKEKQAKYALDLLKEEGIDASIAHTPKRGYYFVSVFSSKNLAEALQEMRKWREKGFEKAWVAVF